MSTPELKPCKTPITDAATKRVQVGGFNSLAGILVVDPEVCRKLESALNEAREALKVANMAMALTPASTPPSPGYLAEHHKSYVAPAMRKVYAALATIEALDTAISPPDTQSKNT